MHDKMMHLISRVCGFAGLLSISIRRQYDIFDVYVCHTDMGQTETPQNQRY